MSKSISNSNFSLSNGSNNNDNNKSGFVAGVINCMNLMIGGAILAMPYATSKLGFVSFTFSSILVMVLSLFTVDLLVQVCIKLKLDNYEEITNVAVIKYFSSKNNT